MMTRKINRRRLVQTFLAGASLFVMHRIILFHWNFSFETGSQEDSSIIDHQTLPTYYNATSSSHGFISLQNDKKSRMENFLLSSSKKNNMFISSSNTPVKFYILAPSKVTIGLLQKDDSSKFASEYYQKALNEESAEIWLYRHLMRIPYDQGHTHNVSEADYFVLPGLLHLYSAWSKEILGKQQDHSFVRLYKEMIVDTSKPHLLMIPTWNPKVAGIIGLKTLTKQLQEILVMGVGVNGNANKNNLWSVGFERNSKWQGGISIDRIIPIPYVVRDSPQHLNFQNNSKDDSYVNNNETAATTATKIMTPPERITDFIFYAGDKRKNAIGWAGCHREKLIGPLQNDTNMNVRIVTKANRLNQSEYNHLMRISDYCLLLCGDTPTSRSLTSAMVSGCIPIRIGSRLRGLCEPPCHKGFGWKPTGVEYPHLPYKNSINWNDYPEVNEEQFATSGKHVLQGLFRNYNQKRKDRIRSSMTSTRNAWIYGWGDPVSSNEFGDATVSILKSFVEEAGI